MSRRFPSLGLDRYIRKRQEERSPTHRRFLPLLEHLEERETPALFNPTTTAELIADINTANGNGEANTIRLVRNATYNLTTVDNYWFGPNGLPAITSDLTIEGNGAAITRDVAAPAFRFFYVAGPGALGAGLPMGTLTLEHVTLSNGLALGGSSTDGGGGLGAGGAIFNVGEVYLASVTLLGNTAQGGSSGVAGLGHGGGGIGQDAQGGTGGGFGGTVPFSGTSSPGTTNNEAGAGGAGWTAPDGVSPSGFAGGNGGGLTGLGGSGRSGGNPGGTGGDGGGGGAGSIQSGGVLKGGAGGAFGAGGHPGNSSATGSGGGGVGGGGGGGLGIIPGGGGFGGGGGGAVSGGADGGFGGGGGRGHGAAGFGGGAGSGGSTSTNGGGGAGLGGAVFNLYGTVTVVSTTFTENTARGGAGGVFATGGSGYGAAVFNLNGSVSVLNATIVFNTVAGGSGATTGDAAGGAVYSRSQGATVTGGDVAATVTVGNSILRDTIGGSDLVVDQGNDVASLTASGHNFIGSTPVALGGATISGTPFDYVNPQLGFLKNNGGGVVSFDLLPGSPAINTGSNALLTGMVDVRGAGFSRVIDEVVDVGAYEYQPPGMFTTLASSQSQTVPRQEITFTATVFSTSPGPIITLGSVLFLDNGTALGTVPVENGVAEFTTASLAAGTHVITAHYLGANQGNFILNPASTGLIQTVAAKPRIVVGGGGQVRVFDLDGRLQRILTPFAGFSGEVRVAQGDVTGDGVPDIIAAPGGGFGPLVRVFNGTNFAPIASFNAYSPTMRGGVFVAVGNFDGDPSLEVVTGLGMGGAPRVRIFNIGAGTGSQVAGPLGNFLAYSGTFRGGVTVAAGDFDGSRPGDEVITGTQTGPALVRVFGRNGANRLMLANFLAFGGAGVSVAAGDVDGDGLAEIIASRGRGGPPLVRLFRDTDARFRGQFLAYPSTFAAGVRVGMLDRDGDGRAETLLTSSGPGSRPNVRLWDSVTLGILDQFFAFPPGFMGGAFVSG